MENRKAYSESVAVSESSQAVSSAHFISLVFSIAEQNRRELFKSDIRVWRKLLISYVIDNAASG
jgi:hypothetical protein